MEKLHFDAAPDSGYISSETAHIARLDDLRQQLRLEGCSLFLKLDVQGYELEVIDGAPTTLRDVAVLEAEMSFVSLYSGQLLFAELVARLRDHGLVLGALEPGAAHPASLNCCKLTGFSAAPPPGTTQTPTNPESEICDIMGRAELRQEFRLYFLSTQRRSAEVKRIL